MSEEIRGNDHYWLHWACSIQTIPHILDEQYPHKCFKCRKDLRFNELKSANKGLAEEQLEKLWKSEAVEFYCCSCYKKETEPVHYYTGMQPIWFFMQETQQNPSCPENHDFSVRGEHADFIIVNEIEGMENAIGVDWGIENGEIVITTPRFHEGLLEEYNREIQREMMEVFEDET